MTHLRVRTTTLLLGLGLTLATTPAFGEPLRTARVADHGTPWIGLLEHPLPPPVYRGAPLGFEQRLRSGAIVPLDVVRADLNGDGLDDVIASYVDSQGGWLTYHRANLDARDPYGERARRRRLEGTFDAVPLLPEPQAIAVPVAPHFVGAGDFDADGHDDLVVAERGRTELWWLRGAASTPMGVPLRVPLPGVVTALVAGEFHRPDGRDDLAIGISDAGQHALLVFRHRDGALLHAPDPVPLSHRADIVVSGPFDAGPALDIAVGGGNRLTLLPGSDGGGFDRAARTQHALEAPILDVVPVERATTAGRVAGFAVLLDKRGLELFPERLRVKDASPAVGLAAANLTARPGQELVLRDPQNDRLLIYSGGAPASTLRAVPLAGPAVAVLPIRLNADAFSDLVVLVEGVATPLVLLTSPASVFVVDSTGDDADANPGDGTAATASGACTLRAAIDEANASPALDRIEFSIAGPGPHTIQPLRPLPEIFEPVEIDGTSEPDYAGTPIIELDGSLAGEVDGLVLLAPGSTVRGLVVNRFRLSGIAVVWPEATENRIQGNFIGTDTTGTIAAPNIGNGVSIINGAPRNTVGTDGDGVADAAERNVISGNLQDGIAIHGEQTNENVVAGNLIGTDANGTAALGNGNSGVAVIHGKSNIIGTNGDGVADAAERNVVAASGGNGIIVLAPGAEDNVVAGNFVGTDATGTVAFGNGEFGIAVVDHANRNRIGTDGDGLADADERNVVSGNVVRGILLAFESEENVVAGNYVGTDPTGTVALPNLDGGVEIANGARSNRIGTDADGQFDEAERNVISGNATAGIMLFGEPPVEDNVIAGNFIGTQADGLTPLANGRHGIQITSDAHNTTIGGVGVTPGSCDGPCNVIAYNGSGGSNDGIRIAAGSGHAVLGNVIHSSVTGGALDIDEGGVTPNDAGDLDAGVNGRQNYPLLTNALTAGGTTTIEGTLDSSSNDSFRVEIYANTACDMQGYGEGEILVATQTVATGPGGLGAFSLGVSPAVPPDHWLSATATRLDPTGVPRDTSEFSPCLGIGFPTSAGRVPNGADLPGTELTLDKGGGRSVLFAWAASCVPADIDYAIYQGTIGDFTSHWPRVCSTEGLTEEGIWTTADEAYFFVVPLSPNREGAYGTDSNGFERPPGDYRCRPQWVGTCP